MNSSLLCNVIKKTRTIIGYLVFIGSSGFCFTAFSLSPGRLRRRVLFCFCFFCVLFCFFSFRWFLLIEGGHFDFPARACVSERRLLGFTGFFLYRYRGIIGIIANFVALNLISAFRFGLSTGSYWVRNRYSMVYTLISLDFNTFRRT